MKYNKQTTMSGAWVKGSEVVSGTRAKLVSETLPQPSTFLNKDGSIKNQDVAKIRFEKINDTFNISLNRATINALVDAFGEDSVNWQNKVLTCETEKVRVAGKAVTALYLIPEGYEKRDDESGYAIICKKGEGLNSDGSQVPNFGESEEEIDQDIPF